MDDDRVLSIVRTLQEGCQHIDSELRIIDADLAQAAICVERYGDVFLAPYNYLRHLRRNKELRYKEIVAQLEGLQTQLDCSHALLQSTIVSNPVAVIEPKPASAVRRF